MIQEREIRKRILIVFTITIVVIILIAMMACFFIQSTTALEAGSQISPDVMALGGETVIFSNKSLCSMGWLEAVFNPNDIYQIKFYNGDEYNSIIISSSDWASQVDATGNKPIIHKIPEYIISEGYDKITVTPISGDGDYSVADFLLLSSIDTSKNDSFNIINYEIKQYEIEIDEADYEKIEQKRIEAINLGILLSDDSDEITATIKSEGKKYKADLRLKGDWTDHLTGNQWSFRIDLSGDNCIYGLQKFSLQPISTRNGLWEYLIYEMYKEQGGVALRYDFADVFVNGVYKGVYAVEEFMSKRVIENSRKREGPIIKISEDFLWNHWAYYMDDKLYSMVYDDSVEVFSEKKTVKSQTLSSYALYAITQLNKLRSGEASADEVFDIDLYARLQAILDIFSAHHGRIWHNIRNYYNPVTGLLEPIPFDEFAFEDEGYLLTDKASYMDYFGFSDCDKYNDLYKQYVIALSQEYPDFIARHQEEIDQFTITIQRYSPTFSINVNAVNERIQKIQRMFDTIIELVFEINFDYEEETYMLSISNKNLLALYITDIQNSEGESDGILAEILGIGNAYQLDGNSTVTIKCPSNYDIEQFNHIEFIYHTAFSEEMSSSLSNECIKLGFFVIGHACGAPDGYANGMYGPVKNYLGKICGNEFLQFGVFTGDFVFGTEEQEYVDFTDILNATDIEWYIAPGNYDVNSIEWYDKYFGQYYGYFIKENNLFIYLDCKERWDISDEQLQMIRTALAQNQNVENIFVFTSQLNWWDSDAVGFEDFVPNSTFEYDFENKPNFYSQVLPLFKTTSQDVYFIAGDTGAFADGCEIYYKEDGRYTYIASGVGGGEKDSALEFYILKNGEVTIQLIALDSYSQDALGSIADYSWKGAQ